MDKIKNLTSQQIQAVINWMETFEQLKGTAIPMRFKEDFSSQSQQDVFICELLLAFHKAIIPDDVLVDFGYTREEIVLAFLKSQ